MEAILKVEDRQLTADEFEEVLRSFYIKGCQRGAYDPLMSFKEVEKSFQDTLFAFGLKTKK